MVEIEAPSGYSCEYILDNMSYATFSNSQETDICKFEPTDNNTRFKLTTVLSLDVGDFVIEGLFDRFINIREFQDHSYSYFIQCTKNQKRVEIIRPDSLSVFIYAGAVGTHCHPILNIV
jgi:hypothetical protein